MAVVFQSIPVSNHPDTCDSLHVTNLALDVVPIAAIHANTSLEVLLGTSHLFSNTMRHYMVTW